MAGLKHRKSSRNQEIEIVFYGQAHRFINAYPRLVQFHQGAASDASHDNAVNFMASQCPQGAAHTFGVMLIIIADREGLSFFRIYEDKDRR
jgi:hypothetical protein